MKMVTGWWIPDKMDTPGSYISRAKETERAIRRTRRNAVAVQAGGHVGIVPRLLAERFGTVYTFEPEAENFACLARNVDQSHVYACRGILGDKRGTVGVAIHSKGTGGHNVKGEGNVPTYRIDDMNLSACDAILLDIEGYEVHALRGALTTIKRYKPLLIIEENKKQHAKGFKTGDIESLLAPFGYRVTDRVGEDLVLEVGR